MPQLIIGAQDDCEQNIAIPLAKDSKEKQDRFTFSAPTSAERLRKPLYLIPSLRTCTIKSLRLRIIPLTQPQVTVRLARRLATSPKLALESIRRENLGYEFRERDKPMRPRELLHSIVELASKNFPDPKRLLSGTDDEYGYWTNSNFETLIPRRKIPVTRASIPLAVAVLAEHCHDDATISTTLNTLRSAGIAENQIFVVENSRNESRSLSVTNETDFLDQIKHFEEQSLLLCLRAGDAVSRTLLDTLETAEAEKEHDFIYFDHDSVSSDGTLYGFQFKPDPSPTSLIFRNYISRAAMTRISLISRLLDKFPSTEELGLFGLLYGCAIYASYDPESTMLHVPVPCFHLAKDDNSLRIHRDGSEHRIRDHLLNFYAPNLYVKETGSRITWQSRMPPKDKVSILIPTKDRADLIRKAVDSIRDLTDYPNFEIVIIDNQSSDKQTLSYMDQLSSDGAASIHQFREPFNFARMHNQVVPRLTSDFVLLLNNDTEIIRPGWLTKMVELFQLPDIGIVGNKLVYPDGTIQHVGATGGLRGPMAHHLVGRSDADDDPLLSYPRDVLAVTGACMLLPRDLYLQNGGMDERLAVSYNDMDICLSVRVKMGYSVVVSSYGGVVHKESKSRGTSFSVEQQRSLNEEAGYFESKWESYIRPDPFYNPNLSLNDDFSLRSTSNFKRL